jgi:hypothetical protein
LPPFAESLCGLAARVNYFIFALSHAYNPTTYTFLRNFLLQQRRNDGYEAGQLNSSQYIKKITDCQGKNRFFAKPLLLGNIANFTIGNLF